MKKTTSQAGSAVLIVVVTLLVVALVGAVGYIAWQNIAGGSEEAATSQDSVSGNTVEESSGEGSDSATLSISEWGVQGDYEGEVSYSYRINEFGAVSLVDPSLPSDCSVGYVTRATSDEDAVFGSASTGMTASEAYESGAAGWGSAQVGSYYYFVTSPQASCGDEEQNSRQSAAFEATQAVVESLR